MAQTIKLKRSATQNAVPSTSQLELGEVAINTYDGKMFIKKDDGTESIVEVGQFATVTPAGSTGDLQFNNEGTLGAATFTFVDDANSRLGIGTDTPSTALEVSGTVTATTFDGSLDFSNLTNLPDPTLTLNGDVSGSATFTNLGNATLTVTVANDSHTHDGRYYTETEADNRFVNVTGDTLTGFLTLHADPTNALHAATKEYVDTVAAASLHYHTPVRLESPTALNATYNNGTNGVGATLTNAGTNAALEIDGVATSLNDRVLVYEQSNAAHNGVYTVTTVGDGSTPWVLTRATDADSYAPSDPDSFGQGDAFYVQEGNTGAGELYVMNTEGTITFGTTGINFVQISSAQIYSAGSGLDLNGTQFSHTDTSTQASVNNSGGTVIQDITLDTFGHITAIGSKTLSTSDISEGTNLYYTDARANSAIDARVDKAFVDALNVDADTLDSLNSTAFIRSDVDDTVAGQLTLTDTTPLLFENTAEGMSYKPQESSSYANRYFLRFDYTNNGSYPYLTNRTPSGDVVIKTGTSAGGAEVERIRFNGGDGTQDIVISSATLKNGSNVYWHAGNDGAGSGLDADLLDGNDASAFVSESGDTMTGNLNFGDNVKAVFGAGSDLQIYHDGSNSYIKEVGTGGIFIDAIDFYVRSTSGEQHISAINNGAVSLFYDNSKKLATTSAGIDVTGTVTADTSLVVDVTSGVSSLVLNNVSSARGARITKNYDDFSANFFYSYHPTTEAGSLAFKGSQDSTQLFINSNGDISFYEDTGTTPKFFWDASAESLGIGTSSPGAKLEVSNDGASQIAITNTSGTTKNTQLLFKDDAGIKWRVGMDVATNNNTNIFQIYNGATSAPAISIDASSNVAVAGDMAITGNVGIGTTSPSGRLEVSDSSSADIYFSRPGLSSSYGAVGLSQIFFRDTANAFNAASIQAIGYMPGSNGALAFKTASGGSTSEAMRIDSSGNVGIGTSSPTSLLNVHSSTAPKITISNGGGTSPNPELEFFRQAGVSAKINYDTANKNLILQNDYTTADTSGNMYFNTRGANTRLTITGAGNVGIGTTSPSYKLQLNSGSAVDVETGVSNSAGLSRFGTRASGNSFVGAFTAGKSLEFWSAGSNTMLLDASGRLLVGGTLGPSSGEVKAVFTGGVSAGPSYATFQNNSTNTGCTIGTSGENFIVYTNSGGTGSEVYTERMRIDSSGNVGIGTSSPDNLLHLYKATNTSSSTTGTTLQKLTNHVGSDLQQQKTFIDFEFTDTNDNETPQVRIGAEVGTNGDATDLIKEGSGAFVVYTNNADTTAGAAGASLAERMRVDYQGYVGIGTTAPSAKLDVAGDIEVNSTFTLNGEEATLATTTQTEIASFSATSYGGGKFVITAKDGSNRHICELLVTHDGTTAVATQYGSIYTSTELATYNVDISSGNVRILATSASTNSTVYKVAETLMEA